MDRPQPIGDSFSIGRGVSHGLRAIRAAPWPMWLAGLLMWIPENCSGAPPLDFGELGELFDPNDPQSSLHSLLQLVDEAQRVGAGVTTFVLVAAAFIMAGLLFGLLFFALDCFLHTGFIRLHVSILTDASDRFGPLFSGKDRFWDMAGFKALSWLALAAAGLATVWPGALLAYFGHARDQQNLLFAGIGLTALLVLPALVYVGLGIYLGELAVALDGAGPVQALRRAWALARGNRLQLFAFALLCFLIRIASYVGVLLCCVGLIVTLPFGRSLTGFAKTEGYLLFTRGNAQTAQWRLWQSDPLEDRRPRSAGLAAPPPVAPPRDEQAPPRDEQAPPPDWPPREPEDPSKKGP